jgi:hypothetical protein
VSTTYYSQLDTVRYDPDLVDVATAKSREVSSAGLMMYDLLAHDDSCVLSQTQAIDTPWILGTLTASAGHEDDVYARLAQRSAFLSLVRSSRIQVKIYDRDLVTQPTEEERISLKNAFLTALTGTFKFTSWPELVDRDLRREAAHYLLTGDDGGVTPLVRTKVDAILSFDEALRDNAATELAMDTGLHLGDMVTGDILHAESWQVAKRRKHFIELLNLSKTPRIIDKKEVPYDLRRRSDWYELLAAYRKKDGLPANHGALASIRSTVDMHYNTIMCRSLGGTRAVSELDGASDVAAAKGSDLLPVLTEQASLLSNAAARGEWLGWAQMPEALDELHGIRGEERLAMLEDMKLMQVEEDDTLVLYVGTTGQRSNEAINALLMGGIAQAATGSTIAALTIGAVGLFIPTSKRLEAAIDRRVQPLQQRARARARRNFRASISLDKKSRRKQSNER